MHSRHESGLLKTAITFIAVATALAVGLLLLDCTAHARGRPWLPKPKRSLTQTPNVRHTVETIRCLVDGRAYTDPAKVRAAERRFEKLERTHFTTRHLNEIAHAAHDGLKRERFPLGLEWQRFLPLLLAHVQQQSHFKRDALSRYNRDRQGRKIRVGNCRKLRAAGIIGPKDRCRSLDWLIKHPNSEFTLAIDGGLFQMHLRTARLVCPGTTIAELLTPAPNLACAATWLRRRAETCVDWLKTNPRRCGKKNDSIRCRCRRVWRKTGALAYQSSTSRTLVRSRGYADQYWRCHDAATEVVNGTPDGPDA